MRRRAKRDLLAIGGVVAVLAGVVLLNSAWQRGDLRERMEALRTQIERERQADGLELLNWNLMRQTRGTMRSGPTFVDALLPYDGDHVDIVGFMVPLNEFRDMGEFLLLPLPLECYFCQIPPMRDVLMVQMAPGNKTHLFNEPVLINGVFNLHEGEGTKFFYSVTEATMGPGRKGGTLTRKEVAPEHMIPQHGPEDEVELMEGFEPPIPVPLD